MTSGLVPSLFRLEELPLPANTIKDIGAASSRDSPQTMWVWSGSDLFPQSTPDSHLSLSLIPVEINVLCVSTCKGI